MRRLSATVACHVAVLCGLAAPAAGQAVNWHQFDPLVVPSTQTQPVLLEASVSGAPSRVNLELTAGSTVEMKDDGTGGDRRAGDGVFTASVPAAAIVGALRADDVQRVFVGFLNVFNGATSVLRGNMFADVHTADVGTPLIAQLAPDVQATAHLVNLVDPQYLTDANGRRVAQTFYRYFGDSYDFLNIISTPSRFANRTHSIVRNDVDGIGLARSDQSALFGSGGRLRGYSQFPIPGFYDGASTGYSHETGHQWINQLRFGAFATGVPHWPVSTMATGTMGFSIGGAGGQGGDFRCKVIEEGASVRLMSVPASEGPVFNDFDLYLMGLIDATGVQPQLVFTGVTTPPSCNGQLYTGPVTRVTVDTIVGGAGRRVPDSAGSPRTFRAATILVSRDGLVSREAMWLYSWLTARAELQTSTATHEGFLKGTGNPFYVMTGGRATIDTLLTSDPDFSLTVAQAAVTVPRGATATFRLSVMPTRASFDQPVTFSCGAVPSPLACTFSPAQLTPGAAGGDVTLTILTGTAATSAPIAMPAGGAMMLLMFAASRCRRRPLPWAAAAAIVCLAAACGGGSQPPATPSTPTSPPAGPTIYPITVTATGGALTHAAILTLTVQ